MNFSLSSPEARKQIASQFAILSLSAFLLGLYYGRDLEAGFDLITLQTGLVGVMALVNLAHVSRRIGLSSDLRSTSNQVERRLERFIDSEGNIRRIDDAEALRIRTPQVTEVLEHA